MLYRAKSNINLYDSSELKDLATQAIAGRFIRLVTPDGIGDGPLKVMVVEDDYPAWLAPEDELLLAPTEDEYVAPVISEAEIRDCLPEIIAFTEAAMAVSNEYLWGGTVAPNYDCSGLMQAAFRSQGIQLPRDAYQQEAFVQPVELSDLVAGDLVFFGTPEKATHVGLYLGEQRYIHSSGKEIGNNGISINTLTLEGNTVDYNYFSQWRGGGRVIASFKSRLG
ncbi:C40 family peptidase [filamentous cyanobacterium LEGE 11480]|uniref:C40 family peptidase n=1 Tax=Romeriopsis navalis LEGE 11480 TaxID=2777977 RepID=A0A928VMT5_9CYAN|nr:C40 family peptidase [Romeriopsis navalis]MBE9028749.1 C40 family peptidase [Romeriopsis navalis LEGE 11480]